MNKLYLLTDYKGRFGSKHDDNPYRSGMSLSLLKDIFSEYGYDAIILPFSKVNPGDKKWKGAYVLYTSSEDPGLIYKQYIEDVVLSLEYAGANLIPPFRYLKANNDKVFMELLRELLPENLRGSLVSSHYGTLEEILAVKDEIAYPSVIKGYYGAMGRNVFLARSSDDLVRIIKRNVSSGSSVLLRIREHIRRFKHHGYQRDSFYRGRFIVQKFIAGLDNDWKVYFFGGRGYVFNRPVFPEREFRASGGGYDNYRYGSEADAPDGLLDFGWEIFRQMDVPHVSMDIAWDGIRFYLLEFQCLYFGTAGILRKYSSVYFRKDEYAWQAIENDGCIERVYAESVVWYLTSGK